MYVVVGATGKTGRIITNILLNHGKDVRAVARNTAKLRELAINGAEAFPGNIEDNDFLVRAFKGVKAAYVMIPPNISSGDIRDFQIRVADNQAEAIEKNNIQNVVSLSSVGAQLTEKAGIAQGLHYMEHRLNRIESLNVKHLRATYFMENLFQTIEMVKSVNKLSLSFSPKLKIPMAGKRDVAKVAVQHLLNLDFKGKSVDYVLGQRDVSIYEVTEVFGKAIGSADLAYSQISYESYRNALMRSGMSESVAAAHVEFVRSINEGRVFEAVERSPENTTPISIEEFSRQYALLYESRQPVFF